MKVFIDIGGHHGETIKEVMKRKYDFDKIYCFEPSTKCFNKLDKIAKSDKRVTICKFGLGKSNSEFELFESGELSASIIKSGKNNSNNIKSNREKIEIMNASEWVKNNLSSSDINVVKINTEGSEIDILKSWINSDCMKIFYSVVVMFDIRNFPESRHLEKEIRKDLKENKYFNYCDADDIIRGRTHEKRINNWLSKFGLDKNINSKEELQKRYGSIIKKYSLKDGRFYQLEPYIKEFISYNSFPNSIKIFFRFIKKLIGKNKETSA